MKDSSGSQAGRFRLPATVHRVGALAAGLFLARVWSESRPAARGWRELALALLAGLAAAAVAALLLRRARLRAWPLLLLGVYVLWPQASGRAALAVGLVSLVALALAQRRAWPAPGCLLDLLVASGALGLYVATLAPSVQPADAGEFQLVASALGIAHPPGYALYTLLGRAFTLLPLGDPAWCVNLFAAVCAAATLAVASGSVRRATGSAAAGLLSALALALAPTFWAQGTFANIRSLTALLAALCIYWLLRYSEARAPRDLLAFAVCFGLGAIHHSSLAILGLPFLAYLAAVDPDLFRQPRRWLQPAAGFGATLLVLLYLPLRSAMSPPFDTPSVRTLHGFVEHVLALGFQGDLLYFLGQPTLGLRLVALADILGLQFGPLLWVGALALGLFAACQRWQWGLLWGGVALVNGFAAITYRAPQTVEYLLPTYLALAVGLGLGLGTALRRWPGRLVPVLLAGLVAWLALSNGLAAYPSFAALHRDTGVRGQAVALLEDAPPGALILSSWHHATPLWYLQEVEGLRRDVTVTYVYPEGATPNWEVWARRIREAVQAQRPVLVTNRYHEYAGLPYRFVRSGIAWRVEAQGLQSAPPGLEAQAQRFGDRIELIGVRAGELEAAPGGGVSVQVAWRPQEPLDRDYSWFVHLVGPHGIAGQADLTYSPGRAPVGEVIVDDYRLPLRPDSPPGEYRLVAGVYVTFADGSWERLRTADGQDAVELGRIHVRPRSSPPATAGALDLAWGDGSRLVGLDYDDSVPGTRRMYLHWYRPAGAAVLDLRVTAWRHPEAVGLQVPGGQEGGYVTVACDLSPEAGLAALEATAGGERIPALGPWHRPIATPSWPMQVPPPGARYLDLGGDMVLAGARWRPETPAPGSPLTAELQFLAQRPLLADYSVSLSLEGQDWRAQHDGTPVLGAVPTLKWLAGWRLRDPRFIAVPAEAQGPAHLRLTVYDAFTLTPLAVGDDRLAKVGQGVQATLWEGVVR
jgi:hypothetical protein